MIISFVNYEVRVKLEMKSADDVREQQDASSAFFADQAREVHEVVNTSGFVATAGGAGATAGADK